MNNFNNYNAPKEKIDKSSLDNNSNQIPTRKRVLDSFETVPSQKRNSKNESKQNKKDCLIY